ncbi:hypothetical protein TH61_16395 [Rufibacter sp. DG15C]|nr:hypothetical protein TH61_16395 [Rufibacter sp. DG15C]
MGYKIKAECGCGLESKKIYQGIGFNYFTTRVRLEPAYCDHCGIVVGSDMSKTESKCPNCARDTKYYFEGMEDQFGGDSDFPPSDYLQSKDFWHCPKCKKETLQFARLGLWD